MSMNNPPFYYELNEIPPPPKNNKPGVRRESEQSKLKPIRTVTETTALINKNGTKSYTSGQYGFHFIVD